MFIQCSAWSSSIFGTLSHTALLQQTLIHQQKTLKGLILQNANVKQPLLASWSWWCWNITMVVSPGIWFPGSWLGSPALSRKEEKTPFSGCSWISWDLQGRCQSRAGGSWMIYLHFRVHAHYPSPNEWDLQEVTKDESTVKGIWADRKLNPWRSRAISLLQDCTEIQSCFLFPGGT